jgi:transposase InsO family protein
LKDLLDIIHMAKSSYCYQVIAINNDKYTDLKTKVKDVFEESSCRYGYRRIHSVIRTLGTTVSEKVIRRIMKEQNICEGFFGRLKNEMFYGYSWAGVTINQFIEELDKYIKWYAEKRIKLSLGGMSPLDYRRSLGLVV